MRAGLAASVLILLGLAPAAWSKAPLASAVPPPRPAAVAPAAAPASPPAAPDAIARALTLAPVVSIVPVRRPALAGNASAPSPASRTASSRAPLVALLPPARPAPVEVARFVPAATLADTLAVIGPTRRAPLHAPLPRARPGEPEELMLASAPAPRKKSKATRKGSVCGNPEIRGEEIAVIKASVKGCGLSDGVSVTAVSGVALSTPAQLDCTTAEALNRWVEGALIPAVGSTGGGVARLQVAASYACRPRNNQKGNRISEHGRGRAIDISAIVLENGKVVSVLSDWGQGRGGKILKSVRAAACGPFTTVLGPGSDSHHRDHLHLDTARGRGPYCR
jgi:hypothetical protein